jgi:uncharacterized protein YjbJ (UPF0337 family)
LSRPAGGIEPSDSTPSAARGEETVMAQEHKVDNKAQELKGKVKEGVGRAVGNERLEAEGKKDQTVGNLKNAGEKVKDAFRD